MIEVERKFNVNSSVIQKIKNIGAVKKGNVKRFTDIYYDTLENHLTRNNLWLRSRNEIWELKSSADTRSSEEKLFNSSYVETVEERDIVKILMPFLKTKSDFDYAKFSKLQNFLDEFEITPFSIITTNRQKYVLGDFIIDIDTTDTGYSVGEVELLVEKKDEIYASSKKIDNFIKDLGSFIFLELNYIFLI